MVKKLFTEYPEKDEQKYRDRALKKTRLNMDKRYGNRDRALRDTHAKTHACATATLSIFDFDEAAIKQQLAQQSALTEAQLAPISLKQGLLAQAKSYPVWLRFANGRTTVEKDCESDTRSLSVKIIGVEGERLPDSHESHTQDIVLQNAEIFFIKTLRDYYGFLSAVTRQGIFPLLWLLFHPQQKSALQSITKRTPKSLLTERYWSGSASALGLKPDFNPSQTGVVPVEYPAAVKFAFTPVESQAPHVPLTFSSRNEAEIKQAKASESPDNYYRDELVQALAKPEAEYCWDFQIQLQTKPEMSIDDVTVVWNEEEAPFFTVGRLTVKQQTINLEKQCDFCENMRFSPWNGLTVHRPIGALNRLRSAAYALVGEYRHRQQGVTYQEPTGQETFD
ncbi:MAG: catalase [Cyanobacteriota bacterium]|nr:catalase [Cyanobacteriota bacterium]